MKLILANKESNVANLKRFSVFWQKVERWIDIKFSRLTRQKPEVHQNEMDTMKNNNQNLDSSY